MKRFLVAVSAVLALFGLLYAVDAVAAAYPPALGGTGTTTAPAPGQVLIGTSGGVYTPAYILCAGTCTMSTSSGGITITGTGIANNAGNWAGTWQLLNPSDFLSSSTTKVISVNGLSGVVTITSSSLGVVWPTVNGNKATNYSIVPGTGVTSTVSGATTTISIALNNGQVQSCSANQFVNQVNASGTVNCGSITFPTAATYTFSAGTGISISQVTSTTNTTTTITNIGVTSFNGATGTVTYAPSTTIPTNNNQLANGSGFITTSTYNGNFGTAASHPATDFLASTTNLAPSTTIPTSYVSTFNGATGITTGVGSLAGTAGQINVSNPTGTVTLSTPQNINTTSSPTFAGLTATGAISAASYSASSTTSSSNIDYLNTEFYINSSIAGTEFGALIQGLYSAASSSASSTNFHVPAVQSGVFTWSTGINFNTNGERASIIGVGGGASKLSYTGTGKAITYNSGSGTSGAGHVTGYGVSGLELIGPNPVGTTTAIFAGGSQGAEGLLVHDNDIHGWGTGIEGGANTWEFRVEHNMIYNNATSVIYDVGSNSGEQDGLSYNDIFDPPIAAGPVKCVYWNTNSWTGGTSVGNSFDDCQRAVEGGNSITSLGDYQENPGYASYGAYDFLWLNNSANTNFIQIGGGFQNDATSSPNVPAQFVNFDAHVTMMGVFAEISGSATSVARFANDSIGSGNAVITICNFTNLNGAVTNLINGNAVPSVNTGVGTGCLTSNQGSWQTGWMMSNGNIYSVSNGGGTAMTLSANKTLNVGSGSTGTTTLQTSGSFGGCEGITAFSSTLSATSCHWQISVNAGPVTSTLCAVSACQGLDVVYKNRGTTAEPIVPTGSDFIWKIGTNASATGYILSPGSSTELYDDGTYWNQLNAQ
jgi:hypothetical protein